VAKVGPATSADKDVANVKYMKALDQCTRLMGYGAEDIVKEAIEEVRLQPWQAHVLVPGARMAASPTG